MIKAREGASEARFSKLFNGAAETTTKLLTSEPGHSRSITQPGTVSSKMWRVCSNELHVFVCEEEQRVLFYFFFHLQAAN